MFKPQNEIRGRYIATFNHELEAEISRFQERQQTVEPNDDNQIKKNVLMQVAVTILRIISA